ncbi:MAG: nucleotidyltransferase family protein [Bacteroidales bacterium]|nr:nucleotidyltransferase family protein [Bacteroidales bacterium]
MTFSDPLSVSFFALLRSGLYERPLLQKEWPVVAALDEASWSSLLELARQQTVVGLIYRAVTHLPADFSLPGDTVLNLMAFAGGIERENRYKAELVDKMMDEFTSLGLHPVLMKGATVAAFYAYPELRNSGDIDLYFPPEDFRKACNLPGCERTSDRSVHLRRDGEDIDLHDRYFDLHCAAEKLPAIGTPEATVLMLSAHILKHAIGTGIGIRQLCDIAMAWQACKEKATPTQWQDLFRRTGTLRWNRLLFSFLEDYLDLTDSPLADQRVSSAPLLDIVLEGGNFGHFAAGRKEALQSDTRRRKRHTFGRFLHRIPFSLHYAPRETFATILTLTCGNLRRK